MVAIDEQETIITAERTSDKMRFYTTDREMVKGELTMVCDNHNAMRELNTFLCYITVLSYSATL